MKKVLALILLPIFLWSIELTDRTVKYRVSYGYFGTLAESTFSIKVTGNRYKIEAKASPTGLAKSMLKNRKEFYSSEGSIINGKLKPRVFRIDTEDDTRYSYKTYKFNHLSKIVHYSREKAKEKYDWKVKKLSRNNKFYSADDIFTLFFNIVDVLPELEEGKKYRYIAVGGNSKTGALDIMKPKKREREEIRELLGAKKNNTILKVYINRKILSSQSGELLLSIDKNGFSDRAVLKDVLLFGDLKIERVK